VGELLKISEVATALKVHRRTVMRWIAAGALYAVRLPGRSGTEYRVDSDELKRFVDSLQEKRGSDCHMATATMNIRLEFTSEDLDALARLHGWLYDQPRHLKILETVIDMGVAELLAEQVSEKITVLADAYGWRAGEEPPAPRT
jgi:excisionase family DNA binding protein